ncbi:MAG TPA: ABC transporter ATP-binding protein [Candidatus Kapabacteria bacterium]|nr:ABC transporter ATP-binding protein [Candidatus Kapabacteria bacterium]
MLRIENLRVHYGAVAALKEISLNVKKGGIVTLIGANGAGKTTTLRAISGIAKVNSGKIFFEDEDITNRAPHKIVARGVCQVPEGRMIFPELTVKENLEMGAYLRRDKNNFQKDFDYIFEMFPRLKERLKQHGGTLSGGEQQMLAIARALMGKPRLLLLDEPSLGIAPILVKTIFKRIGEINTDLGVTVLLVEQNARLALALADYAYVYESGKIILEGNAKELAENPDVQKAYLGGA